MVVDRKWIGIFEERERKQQQIKSNTTINRQKERELKIKAFFSLHYTLSPIFIFPSSYYCFFCFDRHRIRLCSFIPIFVVHPFVSVPFTQLDSPIWQLAAACRGTIVLKLTYD